jgi:hypothetical protein
MILFVHPKTDMTLKEILPLSLPAMVNSIRKTVPVKGRFYDEWQHSEVRQARIILMDIHWFPGIASALKLSFQFKQINPDAVIIAGGVSATVFAPYILRDSRIDFIVRGDGELPVDQLVNALLEDKSPEEIPNVMGRDFESPYWSTLDQETLDSGDYRDISWFPALEKNTLRLHRWSRGRVYSIHPFLLTFRGCTINCGFCLGAPDSQQKVFRRGWLLRSAEKVREDLRAWSAEPRLQFVSVYHDFLTMAPSEYSEQVLADRFDLDIRYEFCRCPSESDMELFCNAFKRGKICFSLDELHATSSVLPDLDKLIARINQANRTGRFESWISYVQGIAGWNAEYRDALRRVVRETGARPDRVDAWWDICPTSDAQGIAPEEEYLFCRDHPNRYWLFNRIFRASILAYAVAPRLTNIALRAWSNNNLGVPVKAIETDEVS